MLPTLRSPQRRLFTLFALPTLTAALLFVAVPAEAGPPGSSRAPRGPAVPGAPRAPRAPGPAATASPAMTPPSRTPSPTAQPPGALPGRSPHTGLPGCVDREARKERLEHLRRVSGTPTGTSAAGAPSAPTTQGPSRPAQPRAETRTSRAVLIAERVRYAGDLARVDYRIPVTNLTDRVLEWQKTFGMDPRAEVVAASILDDQEGHVYARTLPRATARRIYDDCVRPRTMQDPLLLERAKRDELALTLWPVPPRSTVTLHISFVTPLRIRHGERIYRDVLQAYGLAAGKQTRTVVELVEEFTKHPDAVPHMPVPGLQVHPDGGYRARGPVTPTSAGSAVPAAPFSDAIVVPGGGLGKFVGVWGFDAQRFLEERGITPRVGLRIHFEGRAGGASRITPAVTDAAAEGQLMTARFVRGLRAVAFRIRVVDESGKALLSETVEVGAERWEGDADLEAAVAAWHRAELVRRVFEWAGSDELRRAKALRFACRIGVLGHGTAGLAIPSRERLRLNAENRSDFFRRNTTLGNVSREGDVFQPPAGSVDR